MSQKEINIVTAKIRKCITCDKFFNSKMNKYLFVFFIFYILIFVIR